MMYLRKTDVVAVASSGGHWQQLLLATDSLRTIRNVVYVTTKPELLSQAGIKDGVTVADCNRETPLKLMKSVSQCLWIIFRLRPSVVISTGAAPGLVCLAAGRIIGSHTIWIDSFANIEQLSMSGKMARYLAKTWVTQWEHLSTPTGPVYSGELL